MTDSLLDDLQASVSEAVAAVDGASDLEALDTIERSALGKKGFFTAAKKAVGGLQADERKAAGQGINEAKATLDQAIAARKAALQTSARSAQYETERLDLTEVPATAAVGHAHIVTQTWEELEDVFVGMGFRVAEGPQVETDWHNFDAMNIPKGHPARDGFDTIYVNHGEPGSTLLRTHTSPVQMRTMLEQEPPIYVIAPGRVFRRDTADATHMPVFHQLEGLVIDRNISLADLAGTIDSFVEAYFGKTFPSRLRPNYFPFTEPSAEFDLQQPDGSWLEMGGCGMVHPNVLRAGGVDPEEWSAFAFGFGMDRLALMKYGVDDLRDMFANDQRFLAQF